MPEPARRGQAGRGVIISSGPESPGCSAAVRRADRFHQQTVPDVEDALPIDPVGRVSADEQNLHVRANRLDGVVYFLPAFPRHDHVQSRGKVDILPGQPFQDIRDVPDQAVQADRRRVHELLPAEGEEAFRQLRGPLGGGRPSCAVRSPGTAAPPGRIRGSGRHLHVAQGERQEVEAPACLFQEIFGVYPFDCRWQ